ncbi:MAG: DegT/DnrJ/EryC1/StrS family aminotransferase [Armatimonadetes bacterium]|nr:DegT/DnrJ/EryC1/StrS family aminotransferase [Armatimonadota bacterium]
MSRAVNPPAPAEPRPASLRAVLVALAAVGFLAWITPYNDYDLQNTYIAGNLFPTGAMVVLLALALGVNPLLTRYAPRRVFRPHELGLIWCVIAIASGIPAAGLLRYLLPAQTALRYFATPENHWNEQLVPHLKPWMLPLGEEAALTFYSGAASGTVPWSAWRATLVLWFILAAQLFLAVACLTVLLRRQWVERERFAFPLVQLPIAVSGAPRPGQAVNDFLRHPLVWAGASIPMLVHGLNGLNLYFPGVPKIDLHYDVTRHLPTWRPWNAIGGFQFHLYPATIGFAYLLAQEIAFSMWFFRAFELLQRMVMVNTNLATAGNDLKSFAAHEACGAVLALLVMVVLLARPHFREVWRRARGLADPAVDQHEAMRYRTALSGLSLALLGLFATLLQFGLSPLMSLTVLAIGLAMYVAASWGAANAGLMMVQMAFRPSDLLVSAMGSRGFTPSDLVNGSLVENVFWYDLRETLMPSFMNATKMAQETGLQQRAAFRYGALAIALAAGLATVAWLQLVYDRGATQLAPSTFIGHGQRPWREVYARLDPGSAVSGLNLAGTLLGAGMFFGLMALRLRFVAWPLHPIGLVTIYSWTSNQFGPSFFVGWALKAAIDSSDAGNIYRYLPDLEAKWKEYNQVPFCKSHMNGTSALTSMYFALTRDYPPGTEIMVPSYTFFGAILPMRFFGFVPVFVDINPKTATLSVEHAKKVWNPKCRAIMGMHSWGLPCEMDLINDFAKEKGLDVLEDCAHAHGAMHQGKMVGNWSRMAIYSFQATKVLPGIEGGMGIYQTREDFERAAAFGHYEVCGQYVAGSPYAANALAPESDYRRYQGTGLGMKLRMHPLAAVLILQQMEDLAKQNEVINSQVRRINDHVCQLPGLSEPVCRPDQKRVYYSTNMLFVDEKKAGMSRAAVIKALQAEGVSVGAGAYPENHKYAVYAEPQWWHHKLDVPAVLEGCEEVNAKAINVALFRREVPELVAQYIKAFEKVWGQRDQVAKL